MTPATEDKPKKMARPTLVCAACKRLKLKCDRKEPCELCSKHKRVQECTYSTPLKERSDNKSLHLRLLDLEEWRASAEANSASWVMPTKVFAQPIQRRTLLQSFSTNSTAVIDDILVLALEVLHINLHQFTNYNAARAHGDIAQFVQKVSATSPVPVTHFYDQTGHNACVTDHLIALLPSRQVRTEYRAALRNVLWLHPVGHIGNLLDRIEFLQDLPSAAVRSEANGLATYALAAATWALASLSHAATTPSTSTSPLHENLPESVVLYSAARMALTIAENVDPGQLGNTDVFYAAIIMMIYLTHASSLKATHLPTSGLPPNDCLQLEVCRVLSCVQRFWKIAGWFADPADGPVVDPHRVTSNLEKEERRRLSSAILYYEEQFSARLLQNSEVHMSNVSFRSPADLDERDYNTLSITLQTGSGPILHRTTYMVQRNELVKLVKSSDEILREAWKADVRLAVARQELQKEKAMEAAAVGEEDACSASPLDGGIRLCMTLDAALTSSRELNDFVQTLPEGLQNPESEKTDDPRERRVLHMMHNDLVETAALAILNNWVMFLRKAELPTSPAPTLTPDPAPTPASESSIMDQQLKRVGRICIEAAGQLLRALRNQVALFQEDPGFSIHMYSPTTVRRCFAAGVVLSRVAAICDEGDVKACREGLVMAEELMRDMEKWFIAHTGRDAEGGSKAGSPLVILSLLRVTVDFQTGNHHAKLRTGVKRSHTDMLEEVPESVNLKSLEALPVPFTDGKFFFCKLDGPMRAIAQTRQPPVPQPVQESTTEGDASNGARPHTGERSKKIKITRRHPKDKAPLKIESSGSNSPTSITPGRNTPQRKKDPPRLQPAVPIQPYPPSQTPVSRITPSPAPNARFSNGGAGAHPGTAMDPPPEQQVQAPGPSISKPVPTPSMSSGGTHPPQSQAHDTSDVSRYDPQPVVPMIRRPGPHPVQQPPTWHPPASSPVPVQYPPPSFGYMHSSDVPINGVSQYETVQTMPYPSYSVPPQPSQPQPIPMHPMHPDAGASWAMSGSLPQPPPPQAAPPAFAPQPGGSSSAAPYSQSALPPPTPSTYQHVPTSYPPMPRPVNQVNQSVPGTDPRFYNVHPVNESYYATSYLYQHP